eukprot:TRINITY_DN1163_c0_g2_i3.p2 TRINITY_DN1163_c0_g2~~TRINITY_DN1163_c0_g2_i3.p2  ORF type:complete len:101 (+),score=21.89 TRINITY_DN1163_c0_g2_i3:578-880(+)
MTLCDWVSEGNIEKVKTFLFQDLEGVLNFKDELGRTGLHWAADGGNLELTELFLNSGARVNDQVFFFLFFPSLLVLSTYILALYFFLPLRLIFHPHLTGC